MRECRRRTQIKSSRFVASESLDGTRRSLPLSVAFCATARAFNRKAIRLRAGCFAAFILQSTFFSGLRAVISLSQPKPIDQKKKALGAVFDCRQLARTIAPTGS